jgi:(2Fe-2S) ferredoxin
MESPAQHSIQAMHEAGNDVVERKVSKRVRLPKPKRSPTYLVVHRYQDSVYYRSVDRETFLLLSAIHAGEPLAAVVDQAFAESALSAMDQGIKIQECFAHAAELGWLVATQRS